MQPVGPQKKILRGMKTRSIESDRRYKFMGNQKQREALEHRIDDLKRWKMETPSSLKPHTPSWFAALEQIDPLQANMTRANIAVACNEDVCSLCGTPAAADYLLLSNDHPLPLKLCDFCRDMYRRAHGVQNVRLWVEGHALC